MKRYQIYISLGVLCLIIAVAAGAVADQTATNQKSDYELMYWESIKDSDNVEMYRAYLKRFPNGVFADLAEIKIRILEPKALPAKKQAPKVPVNIKRVQLRSTPRKLKEKEVKAMLKQYGFCDLKRNKTGDFKNVLIDNQDGTITDEATGLIWEKVGSWHTLTKKRANDYIEDLNWKKFAGRSDWRLPTLEELASLIEGQYSKRDWLYINPLFGDPNGDWVKKVWTSDTQNPIMYAQHGGWVVNFKHGTIWSAHWKDFNTKYRLQNESNNVRAVCSKK